MARVFLRREIRVSSGSADVLRLMGECGTPSGRSAEEYRELGRRYAREGHPELAEAAAEAAGE